MSFFKDLGAGIISGFTGNPLGTLINGFKAFSGIGEQKRQRKSQQALMDYQDQINDANYDKQLQDQRQLIAEDREYNSIGSQMQRAREAGVSPLAALGVASGNSVSASSPSENGVSVPSPSRSSLAEFASSIRAAQLDKAQIDKTREEIENLRVERATEKLNQRKLELDNLILEMEQQGWTELRQKQLNKLENEIAKLQRSAEVDSEVAQTERDTRQEKVNQLKASANDLNASADLKRFSKQEITAKVRNLNANSSKQEFEDWYQRTFGTHLSSGLNAALDKVIYMMVGNPEKISDVVHNAGSVDEQVINLLSYIWGDVKHAPKYGFDLLKKFLKFVAENVGNLNSPLR